MTQFKFSAKEIERGDLKGFVDRFKQSVGDVRAIDAKQVPAEEMLMTIFRSAIQEQDQFLWGLLKIYNSMTLEQMISITSAETANYTALSGNLRRRIRESKNLAAVVVKTKFTVRLSTKKMSSASLAKDLVTRWLAAMIRRQRLRGLLNERRRINQSAITTVRITARAGRSTEIAMSGVIRVEIFLIVTIIVRVTMIVLRERKRSNLILGAVTAG